MAIAVLISASNAVELAGRPADDPGPDRSPSRWTGPHPVPGKAPPRRVSASLSIIPTTDRCPPTARHPPPRTRCRASVGG
jgi:hypothetical protein